MPEFIVCRNCKNAFEFAHLEWKVDSVTGEWFLPLYRIVDDQIAELWPEDYICEQSRI